MRRFSGFPFFLGVRNFFSFRKGRKRTMAGAAVAVALSVIPLIVVIEVSDGMIEGITRRFIELETGHIQVVPFEDYSVEELSVLSKKLTELPSVVYASPVYRGTGLIYSESFRTGIQLKAMEPDIVEKDSGFAEYLEISDGDFDLGSPSGIMLSREIARQLDVKTGETVKLLTARTTSTGRIILRPEAFQVTGIFSTGYYEVDAMSGYLGIGKGEKLFRGEGQLSIQCKITDPYNDAENTAALINDALGIDASVVTWYGMQRSMYESLYTTRMLLVFIMAIIVVVASVNITSSMIIMVIERRQDIAILRSCGTSGRQIRQAFIITGMMTGLTGAAAGSAAGIIISLNINGIINFFRQASGLITALMQSGEKGFSILSASEYYLDKIPISLEPGKIALVGCASVALAVLAAILPARKAEKMMPLEVMRKY